MNNATSNNQTAKIITVATESFQFDLAQQVYEYAKQTARRIFDQRSKDLDEDARDALYDALDAQVEALRPQLTEATIRYELAQTLGDRQAPRDMLRRIKNDTRLNEEECSRLVEVTKEFYPPLDEEEIASMINSRSEGYKKATAQHIILLLMKDSRIRRPQRNALLGFLNGMLSEIIGPEKASTFMDEEVAKYQQPARSSEVQQLAPKAYEPEEQAILDRMELIRGQMKDAGIDPDEEGIRTEASRQLTYEHNERQACAA